MSPLLALAEGKLEAQAESLPRSAPEKPSGRWGQDTTTLLTVALCLVSAATAWYLLKEFATFLRPLLLAVFLCYVIVPVHLRLKQKVSGIVSMILIVGGSVAVLFLLALMIQSSVVELIDDLPRLEHRAKEAIQGGKKWMDENAPGWLVGWTAEDARAEELRTGKIREIALSVANVAGDILVEAFIVGFYMLFLLLEVSRFPLRVRKSFVNDQANQILAVVSNINTAIAGYLRVKVQASLLLAIPVTLVLWVFGVKFPILWGVLTFLCNFIPYLGSIIALSVPILFAFLEVEPIWKPVAASLGVATVHIVMTYLVEPTLVGKGVGLSPLVILAALAFWGQCWGLIGMFLAVPLTVMLKIILENVAFTRPFAKMWGEE
jgi:AI-2 transport protein TqsA